MEFREKREFLAIVHIVHLQERHRDIDELFDKIVIPHFMINQSIINVY